jgi:hypothetical protein
MLRGMRKGSSPCAGREDAVEAEPDEALHELMQGEERGQRGEEQLAAMLDARESDDTDTAQDGAADEVGCGGEAHVGYSLMGLEPIELEFDKQLWSEMWLHK